MQNSVDFGFGTVNYQPSSLERFVMELSEEWRLELDSFGTYYDVQSERQTLRRFSGGSRYDGVVYRRFVSEDEDERLGGSHTEVYRDTVPSILANSQPVHEDASIKRNGKRVDIEFQDDAKQVTVYVEDVVRALEESGVYNLKEDDAVVKLPFRGTTSREGTSVPNPQGDMEKVYAFVRTYLSR